MFKYTSSSSRQQSWSKFPFFVLQCWLDSCCQITDCRFKFLQREEREGRGEKSFIQVRNQVLVSGASKGFLYPLFIIAISHSKTCFAEISTDQSGFHRVNFKVSIWGGGYYYQNRNTLISCISLQVLQQEVYLGLIKSLTLLLVVSCGKNPSPEI